MAEKKVTLKFSSEVDFKAVEAEILRLKSLAKTIFTDGLNGGVGRTSGEGVLGQGAGPALPGYGGFSRGASTSTGTLSIPKQAQNEERFQRSLDLSRLAEERAAQRAAAAAEKRALAEEKAAEKAALRAQDKSDRLTDRLLNTEKRARIQGAAEDKRYETQLSGAQLRYRLSSAGGAERAGILREAAEAAGGEDTPEGLRLLAQANAADRPEAPRQGRFLGRLGGFGRLFGALYLTRSFLGTSRARDVARVDAELADTQEERAAAEVKGVRGTGIFGIGAEIRDEIGEYVPWDTARKIEDDLKRSTDRSRRLDETRERLFRVGRNRTERAGFLDGGRYGESREKIETGFQSESRRLTELLGNALARLNNTTDPEGQAEAAGTIKGLQAELIDQQRSRDFSLSRLDKSRRAEVFGLRSQGETALLGSTGQSYAARDLGIRRRLESELITERDPALAVARIRASVEDRLANRQQSEREYGVEAERTGRQTSALKLGIQGSELQSAAEAIRAKFLPIYGKNGAVTGFLTDQNTQAEGYQQAFQSRLESFNAELGAAGLDDERRSILRRGQVTAGRLQFARNPLGAELFELTAQRRAALVGVTDAVRQREINDQFDSQEALAGQSRSDQETLLNISVFGQAAQTRRLLARDPTGAQAEGLRASILGNATGLRQRGFADQANTTLQNGVEQLALLKQSYLDGFRAEAKDLRLFDVTNPRDSQDPVEVLKEIRDAAKALAAAVQN